MELSKRVIDSIQRIRKLAVEQGRNEHFDYRSIPLFCSDEDIIYYALSGFYLNERKFFEDYESNLEMR